MASLSEVLAQHGFKQDLVLKCVETLYFGLGTLENVQQKLHKDSTIFRT